VLGGFEGESDVLERGSVTAADHSFWTKDLISSGLNVSVDSMQMNISNIFIRPLCRCKT
jgi:hypothetical protein